MARTIAFLIALIFAALPAVSLGVTMNVLINGSPPVNPGTTPGEVDIAGTYGSFKIGPCAGCPTSTPRVFSVDGTSVDKLVLTDSLVTFTGTGTGTLIITFTGLYDSAGPTQYGDSLQGTFIRGASLASGDSVQLIGQFKFFGSPASIGTLNYTVPTSGSLSLNTFTPPNPPQGTTSTGCDGPCPAETLLGQLTLTFAHGGDSVRIPGSAAILGAFTPLDLERALASEIIPEPSSLFLLASGLGGFAFAAWKRHRKNRLQ